MEIEIEITQHSLRARTVGDEGVFWKPGIQYPLKDLDAFAEVIRHWMKMYSRRCQDKRSQLAE